MAASRGEWKQVVETEDWWGTPLDQRRLVIYTETDDEHMINLVGCATYFSLRKPCQRAVLKPDVALD